MGFARKRFPIHPRWNWLSLTQPRYYYTATHPTGRISSLPSCFFLSCPLPPDRLHPFALAPDHRSACPSSRETVKYTAWRNDTRSPGLEQPAPVSCPERLLASVALETGDCEPTLPWAREVPTLLGRTTPVSNSTARRRHLAQPPTSLPYRYREKGEEKKNTRSAWSLVGEKHLCSGLGRARGLGNKCATEL
jgi:hypothetical protein